MLAGDLYIADDPELARDSLRAMRLMAKFNQGAADSPGERRRILKKLLGAIGEGTEIRPPLYCDYGYQIQIGAWTFVNFGLHLSSRRVSSSRRRKLIGQLPMPSLGCSQWHHPPAQEEGGSRQPRAMLGSGHPGCRRPLGTFSSSTMWWEAAGVSSVTPRSDEYGHGHYRQLSK
jgi:hypothetical protein